jgi:hypothetical protein
MKFYTNFPREVGRYRDGIATSMERLVAWINQWNGVRDMYTSVYGFSDINNPDKQKRYNSAIIDRIYWDIDPHWYDQVTKQKTHIGEIAERGLALSDKLIEDGVPHWIVASGSGINIYGKTTDFPVSPDRKKDVLYAIGSHYDDSYIRADTLHGDVARISRIPGTRNMKFKQKDGIRYAVFVTRKDLETGNWLHKSKNNINKLSYVKGKTNIDLHYWEENAEERYLGNNFGGMNEKGIDESIELNTDWYCVKQAMERCGNGAVHTNRDRFIVLSYMFNMGYSAPQARGLVNKEFSFSNRQKVLMEGQIDHIYERGISFPSKTRLTKENRCNDCNLCLE